MCCLSNSENQSMKKRDEEKPFVNNQKKWEVVSIQLSYAAIPTVGGMCCRCQLYLYWEVFFVGITMFSDLDSVSYEVTNVSCGYYVNINNSYHNSIRALYIS